MRILLTGASGFLGRNLYRHIVDEGYPVDSLIHKSALPEDFIHGVTLENALVNISKGLYQVVIHTATSYGRDGKINAVLESNLIMPLRILDALQKNQVFFINIDSFFNKNVSQYYTLPHYSLSKKSLLMWLAYYSLSNPVINLRLEHLYGVGDGEQKFVSRAIREIGLQNSETFKLTSGLQKRDFINVKDVCEAICLLLGSLHSHEIGLHEYEIGTGESITIKEFVEKIKEISSSTTILEFGAINAPPGEIQNSFANNTFKRKFGWQPKIELEEGIQELLDYHGQ